MRKKSGACVRAQLALLPQKQHTHRTSLAPPASLVLRIRFCLLFSFSLVGFSVRWRITWPSWCPIDRRPTGISKSWKTEWRRNRLLSKPKFQKRMMKKFVERPWFVSHKASRMGLAASSPGLGGHSGGDIIRRCNCYSVNNLSLDRKCYRHSLTFNTQGDKTNINPK